MRKEARVGGGRGAENCPAAAAAAVKVAIADGYVAAGDAVVAAAVLKGVPAALSVTIGAAFGTVDAGRYCCCCFCGCSARQYKSLRSCQVLHALICRLREWREG
jgi:hypothetical protein